jgi:transaldolase
LADFSRQGIDTAALAAQLQREGAEAFATSWRDLMSSIAAKSAQTVSRAAQQR